MTYTVAITKQGQISIPAKVRELLGFKSPGTLVMRVENTKATIEPVKGLLSLEGILKDEIPQNLKGKNLTELKKIQRETITQVYVQKHKRYVR